LTYSKEVTNKIVECWGLGFTAEETVKTIKEWKDITIALHTVYRHRHSLTAQQIIEELMRKQFRDIANEEDSEVRMRFRDKLLEKLIPQRIETKGELTQTQQILHLHMWKPEQIEQQPAT